MGVSHESIESELTRISRTHLGVDNTTEVSDGERNPEGQRGTLTAALQQGIQACSGQAAAIRDEARNADCDGVGHITQLTLQMG